ncbi:hypothetical protein EDEG_01807 [Edhazardia aedis USNM 41457]|uniref:Transmembrane protein n=1 Tax=Edhazardia aedis (strain USNM 41457) TaxID=1003232 RepID=J9DRD2_EDHAE|nr:hypothetical protein EDEG_01807 [Edhazardia aedis USNM 41457]|eukprot:EJW03897.1 hypothetical protein EDEG_01807 [Edhazardia aedis USNM 41457]
MHQSILIKNDQFINFHWLSIIFDSYTNVIQFQSILIKKSIKNQKVRKYQIENIFRYKETNKNIFLIQYFRVSLQLRILWFAISYIFFASLFDIYQHKSLFFL